MLRLQIMSKPSFSETLLDWLSRHDGRDKIIRILCYGSMLVGSSDRIRYPILRPKNKSGKDIVEVGGEKSNRVYSFF